MSGRLHGRTIRLGLAMVIAAVALAGVMGRQPARAQAPAQFAYVTFIPGWNLVAFAGGGDYSGNVIQQSSDNALFTWRPGDSNYEASDPSKAQGGYGYWLHVTKRFNVLLDISDQDSTRVNVSAGECVLVGNPSTRGSARVRGADRSFEFSVTLNDYVPTDLIGIGRAAWVCNDTHSGPVSVGYEGDQFRGVNWPGCCDAGPTPNLGQGLVVFQNASDAPLIVGLRQTDTNGDPLTNGDGVSGAVAPSGGAGGCDGAASFPFSMAPGTYTLHIQFEQPSTPDIQLDISIEPDHKYLFCYHPGT
ncbi:MAG TPA: hypothetical protein VKV26_05475 [Dehalococcoidia bacterium]|nr:hypothetical protein [Dehalococcoidia bacterium]